MRQFHHVVTGVFVKKICLVLLLLAVVSFAKSRKVPVVSVMPEGCTELGYVGASDAAGVLSDALAELQEKAPDQYPECDAVYVPREQLMQGGEKQPGLIFRGRVVVNGVAIQYESETDD